MILIRTNVNVVVIGNVESAKHGELKNQVPEEGLEMRKKGMKSPT